MTLSQVLIHAYQHRALGHNCWLSYLNDQRTLIIPLRYTGYRLLVTPLPDDNVLLQSKPHDRYKKLRYHKQLCALMLEEYHHNNDLTAYWLRAMNCLDNY